MALWQPLLIGTTLRAFWMGDDVAGTDGTAVASWVDRTVNAYTLTQGTGLKQPTVQTDELNSHRTIRFDGSNDRMTVASTLGISAQPLSSFAVWKMANSGEQVLHHCDTTEIGTYINTAGNLNVRAGADLTAAITKNAWRMTCSRFNGASSSASIDGGSRTTGNAGTSTLASSFVVGAHRNDAGYWLNGDIATLLIFSTAITQAEEDQLYGWAAWTFGLTASLGSSHPYKSGPPRVGGSGLRYPIGAGLRQRTVKN